MTSPANIAPPRARGLFVWILVALAAGLALAVIWSRMEVMSLRTENAALDTERELAEITSRTIQNHLNERSLIAENLINELGRQLREKEDLSRLKVVSLDPKAPGMGGFSAIALWDQVAQNGLLVAIHLPGNSEDDDYALWIDDLVSHRTCAARIFHVDENKIAVMHFALEKPVAEASVFRLSRKKKQDDPAKEGPTCLESRP